MKRWLWALAVAVALHLGLLSAVPGTTIRAPPTPEIDPVEMTFFVLEPPPSVPTETALKVSARGGTRSPAKRVDVANAAVIGTIADEEPTRKVAGFYDLWLVDEIPTPRSVPRLHEHFDAGTSLSLVVTVAASGRVEGVAADFAVKEQLALDIRATRFLPAMLRGEAVTTTVPITLLFEERNGGLPTWKRAGSGWALQP